MTILKKTRRQLKPIVFYYQYVLAILNEVSDQILLVSPALQVTLSSCDSFFHCPK